MERPVIALYWFLERDWDWVQDTFEEPEVAGKSYQDWYRQANIAARWLTASGYHIRRIPIDPRRFPKWCRAHGHAITLDAAIRFAQTSKEFVIHHG